MEIEDQQRQEGDNIHLELEIPLELLQYLNSEGCDLQKICRLCLYAGNEAPLLVPTSQFCVTEEVFQAMTSVQISSNDELPSRICSNCQMELDHYFKFRSKCEKSDYLLRSLLKEGLTIKKEPKCESVNTKEDDMNNREISLEPEETSKDSVKSKDCEDTLKSEHGLAEKVYNCYSESKDYHDELKSILSEDEALCIVQDTLKNERKFTIYERGTEALTEMIFPKSRKKTAATTQFECMFCSQEFRHLKRLEAHQNQHMKEISRSNDKYSNPYPCKECKETFHSEFDLSLHSIIHNAGPWKCSICGKNFNEKPALRRHIQRHMDSKRYACDACGKTFVELYALKRHARVHTGERTEKKHACTECDKRFSDSNQLMVHMTRHNGEKPFQCVICGKSFPSARLLRSHRLVHSDLKKHACEYCDKRFRHESTRNTHHRTHTGEKPYVCSICGKSFIQASNLRLHMRTHTGEKPYPCSQCDSKFSSGSTLKAHLRTHTGERPYKCKVCGKSFARVNMKLHMRLHSGERPFACSACPKKYVSAAHLRSHCRAHTGEKPFECAKCQSKFATKSLLIKHLQSKKKLSTKPSKEEKPSDIPSVNEFLTMPVQQIDSEIPNAIVELTLGTHETLDVSQELVIQDNNIKTHVIVLGSSNTVSFMSNNENGESGLNIVTVNEIGVSMSSTNSNSS